MLIAQPTTERPQPANLTIDAEDPAEVERRRLASMDNRTRRAMEHDQREAARQAERERAEELAREEAEANRAKRDRDSAQMQAIQAAWAATRDELRSAEKTCHDEAVRTRAELEVAYREADTERAVEIRRRVDVAEELESRASDRLAAHMKTQPTYTVPLR